MQATARLAWDPATGPGSAVLVKSDGDGNVLEAKLLAEGEAVEPDKETEAKEEQKVTLLTNNATGSEEIPLKEYDEGIAEAGEPCVTPEEKKAEALKSIE